MEVDSGAGEFGVGCMDGISVGTGVGEAVGRGTTAVVAVGSAIGGYVGVGARVAVGAKDSAVGVDVRIDVNSASSAQLATSVAHTMSIKGQNRPVRNPCYPSSLRKSIRGAQHKNWVICLDAAMG